MKLLIFLLTFLIWSSVFADNIGYTTAGVSTTGVGNNATTNTYGSAYTSGNAGAIDSAYAYIKHNWNGTDTVVILLYDDTGGYPHTLISESDEIEVSSGGASWVGVAASGTILASTSYWVFVRNKTITSANVIVYYDANTISGYRTSDPTPTDDPFADGATSTPNTEHSIYFVYTASGAEEPSTRRRKIILRGEYQGEKIPIYAYIPVLRD